MERKALGQWAGTGRKEGKLKGKAEEKQERRKWEGLTVPAQEVSDVLDHGDPPPDIHVPAVNVAQHNAEQIWRADHHLNQHSRLQGREGSPQNGEGGREGDRKGNIRMQS